MKNDFIIESSKPMQGRVWMNGIEVTGLTAVKIEMGTDKVTTVTLEIFANTVNFKGEADVKNEIADLG